MRFKHFILSVMMGFALMIPIQAKASDYKNMRNSAFVDVERVYILLEDYAYKNSVNMLDLSEYLRPEFIEKILISSYQKRFSSSDCSKFFAINLGYGAAKNPYGCNDQPIKLFYSRVDLEKDESFFDEGTLIVHLKLKATNDNELTFEPFISLTTLLYRPALIGTVSLAFDSDVIPVNANAEKIKKTINNHILRLMR